MPTKGDYLNGRPLLDLTSYAATGQSDAITCRKQTIELIDRTVSRTPEVMVKVLSRGGQNLNPYRTIWPILAARGELDLETDEGQAVSGADPKPHYSTIGLGHRDRTSPANLAATNNRQPSQTGSQTSVSPCRRARRPTKVLQAVGTLLVKSSPLKHRYAIVLHTDEPHPHVHMVVKAVSEQGIRLNIKKARCMARECRCVGFARSPLVIWEHGHALARSRRSRTTAMAFYPPGIAAFLMLGRMPCSLTALTTM